MEVAIMPVFLSICTYSNWIAYCIVEVSHNGVTSIREWAVDKVPALNERILEKAREAPGGSLRIAPYFTMLDGIGGSILEVDGVIAPQSDRNVLNYFCVRGVVDAREAGRKEMRIYVSQDGEVFEGSGSTDRRVWEANAIRRARDAILRQSDSERWIEELGKIHILDMSYGTLMAPALSFSVIQAFSEWAGVDGLPPRKK